MSKGPVVIEVTRGPVVESRHEGIAAVVKADGTIVDSWGDIDAAILPRSANKPIQAMAFVESGAVERFGLGNEHIALSCASHSGEPRHVETVRAWLKKVGLSEADLECGTHAPRLQDEHRSAGARGRAADRRLQQLLGQAQRLPDDCRAPMANRPRATSSTTIRCSSACARSMSDLCGLDANAFPHGTDGCGIPTLATPLKQPGPGDGDHGRSVAAVEQARRRGPPHS